MKAIQLRLGQNIPSVLGASWTKQIRKYMAEPEKIGGHTFDSFLLTFFLSLWEKHSLVWRS